MRIISGKYGHRRFVVPKNITARPTTDFAKENLFNVLAHLIDFDQTTALDLFSGTGAISFELLSRGCSQVVSVEAAATQHHFICKVQRELKDSNLLPLRGDVFKYIATARQSFDFIFADPPYDLPQLNTLPQLILDSPLLKPDGILVVEHSRTHTFAHLPQFREIRTYGSVNFSIFECPAH